MASVEWLRHFHIHAKGALYNAVDIDKINRIKNGRLRDFRQEYGVPDDGMMICFTGRLIKEKGIYQLVEAVRKLDSNSGHKRYYLFIAGDGEEYQQIYEQKSEQVILLGRINMEEVIGLLSDRKSTRLNSSH